MYYGPVIMQNAGIEIPGLTSDESSLILNIPLGFANFLGTIVCIFTIEKFGRRYLLLRTVPVMAACWFVAGLGMIFTGESYSSST